MSTRLPMMPPSGRFRLSSVLLLAMMFAMPVSAQTPTATPQPTAQTGDAEQPPTGTPAQAGKAAGQGANDKAQPVSPTTPPKSDDAGKRRKREDRKDPERELEEEEDI